MDELNRARGKIKQLRDTANRLERRVLAPIPSSDLGIAQAIVRNEPLMEGHFPEGRQFLSHPDVIHAVGHYVLDPLAKNDVKKVALEALAKTAKRGASEKARKDARSVLIHIAKTHLRYGFDENPMVLAHLGGHLLNLGEKTLALSMLAASAKDRSLREKVIDFLRDQPESLDGINRVLNTSIRGPMKWHFVSLRDELEK